MPDIKAVDVLLDKIRSAPRKTNDSPMARLRMERGLTQGQLAELIGCYPKDISRWERGERKPKVENLIKIADALGCDLRDLI